MKKVIAMVMIILLVGCVPTPTATPAPTPTYTPMPTCTPTETATPVPTALPTATPAPMPPVGTVGMCHGVSYPWPAADWAYPSGETVFWSSIERAPGTYDFSNLWKYVGQAETAGRYIVLQVQTNSPGNFPQPTIPPFYWGIVDELPDCPASVPDCAAYYHSKPAPWDEDYLQAVERMAQAFAAQFDGHPTVMAVLIAGPGNYNEMSQTVGACYGSPGADVTRTDSIYIRSLAKHTGESPSALTAPFTDEQGRYYAVKFDYYYVRVTERLARAYLNAFRRTPVILQLGSGASCQMYVARYVVDDLLSEYGSRLWLKQNGWGNTTAHPTYGYAWDSFFSAYKGRTRTIYEVGHYSLWCDASHPEASQYGCALQPPATALAHNTTVMENALKAGVSAVCFQQVFFRAPDVFGITAQQMQTYAGRLWENVP